MLIRGLMLNMPQCSLARISGVSSEAIDHYWPLVDHWILPLIEKDIREDEESVLRQLRDSEMQLWVVHDDVVPMAAVVTQIITTRKKKICTVVYTGGKGMEHWLNLLDWIEDWAWQNGCDAIEGNGRLGWLKILGKRGYDHVSTTLRKERDG